MATLRWRGDCQGRAQVVDVTISDVEVGDVLTLTINRKDLSHTAETTDMATNLSALAALVGASSTVAEFRDLSAALQEDGAGNVVALRITGQDDGEPFTLTGAAAQGAFLVNVTRTRTGAPGQNEIQRIAFGSTPTGGTFTLSFSGQTTSAIDYDATEAEIETALESLSNIASGDVIVTGALPTFTVEFASAYAETDVPAILVDGASLTGGTLGISISTTQAGGADGTSAIWSLEFSTDYNELITYTFSANVAETGDSAYVYISRSMTAAEVEAAFNSSFTLGTTVTATEFSGNGGFRLEFGGTATGKTVTMDDDDSGQAVASLNTQGSGGGATNETQVVTLTGSPAGGTLTLTFDGETTSGIDYDATAAVVKTALETLSNITTVNVTKSGWSYTVEFEDPGGEDVPQMTGDASSLSGISAVVTVTQVHSAAVNEQQRVAFSSGATGGTFTLTYSGQTTSALDWDSTAAEVDAALEALSNIGAGDVSVSGSTGGPWTITFTSALAAATQPLLTGSGASLTGDGTQDLTVTSVTSPTGPNWLGDAENWDGNAVPATGDRLVFEDSDVSCLWGLETLDSVELAELVIRRSYTGAIGLPNFQGDYYEYRPTDLKIKATRVTIGEGDGGGAGRIRLNLQTFATTIYVYATGQADGVPHALQIQAVNSANVLNLLRGDVGIATGKLGTASEFATVRVSSIDSPDSDATLELGRSVTLATLLKTGGAATVAGSVTTIVQDGGTLVLVGDSINVTALAVRGGSSAYYQSNGTITAGYVGRDSLLDVAQDLRSRTITTLTLEPAATVNDPWSTLTVTNAPRLVNCTWADVVFRSTAKATLVTP